MIKILKFSASWCNPCKALAKTLEEVDLPITSYDVEDDEVMAEKYNIMSVPVLVFVNEDGTEIDRILGAVSKDTVINKYNELNV